jgi:hypothetical protein
VVVAHWPTPTTTSGTLVKSLKTGASYRPCRADPHPYYALQINEAIRVGVNSLRQVMLHITYYTIHCRNTFYLGTDLSMLSVKPNKHECITEYGA